MGKRQGLEKSSQRPLAATSPPPTVLLCAAALLQHAENHLRKKKEKKNIKRGRDSRPGETRMTHQRIRNDQKIKRQKPERKEIDGEDDE
jgi:hypothetical protein